MQKHSHPYTEAPLDLSKWRQVPNLLIGVGAVLSLAGLLINTRHFAFAWLVSFMFFLSLALGGLFLTLAHHLFDAGWSVPIRRVTEHLGGLMKWIWVFFIPIALLAPQLYEWMTPALQANPPHALHVKYPLFTKIGFYVASVICFLVWALLASKLRGWSLRQDKEGGSLPTFRLRFHSCWGVFAFAFTLTLGAIMWMKGLSYIWFSTMFGVIYFAGSAWLTLATVYVITVILDRQNLIREVLHENQYYYLGTLIFAFTVFYTYVAFSQYFIIWNANMPEETFWYLMREKGTWFAVSMVLIFGHFFLPFLSLLRIDVKSTVKIMGALAVWAWLMHYTDLVFNIKPVVSPEGYPWQWAWLDFGCMALMAGVLARIWLANFNAHAPYPIKDPRLSESMGHRHPVGTAISGAEMDEADTSFHAPAQGHGGAR
jgi:hypothetical protein